MSATLAEIDNELSIKEIEVLKEKQPLIIIKKENFDLRESLEFA